MSEYVRVTQAARLLGLTRDAVYKAVRAGRIAYSWQHGLLLVNPASYQGRQAQHERTEA